MKYFFSILLVINTLSITYASRGNSNSLKFVSNVKPFNFTEIKNLITFGDSYTSLQVNFDDMTYDKNIDRDNIMHKWTLVMERKYNKTLWNFAVGGSVVDREIVQSDIFDSSFILHNQIFLDRMPKGKKFGDKWNGDDSLFAYWYGTNDNIYLDRQKYNNYDKINEVTEKIVESLFSKLDNIYEIGARNFLFMKAVNLYDLPYTKNRDRKSYKNVAVTYNNHLIENVQDFHIRHPDTNVFVYADDAEFKYLIDNYKKYNYANNDGYYDQVKNDKTKDPNDYIWIDGLHPSGRTHEILCENMKYFLETGDTSDTNGMNKYYILCGSIVFIIIFVILSLYWRKAVKNKYSLID